MKMNKILLTSFGAISLMASCVPTLVSCDNTPINRDYKYEYFVNGQVIEYQPKYVTPEGSTTTDEFSGEALYLTDIKNNNEIFFDDLFYEQFLLASFDPEPGFLRGCLEGGQLSIDSANKRLGFNYAHEYSYKVSNDTFTDQITYSVEKLPFDFHYAGIIADNKKAINPEYFLWIFNIFGGEGPYFDLDEMENDKNWCIKYSFNSNNPAKVNKNISFSYANYKDGEVLLPELYNFLDHLDLIPSHYLSNVYIPIEP